MDQAFKLMERRAKANNALFEALKHLSMRHIVAILTSFMSIEELEALAKLQSER